MKSLKLILMLSLCAALAACGAERGAHSHGAGASHGEAGHDEPAVGPHGGRLLQEGDLAVELAIHETGVPPEYRAWVTWAGKPVDPREAGVDVVLTRIDGRVETHQLVATAGFLRSQTPVREPHSFDVEVRARYGEQRAVWRFPSYEGRVEIVASIADDAGIRVAEAGSGRIVEALSLHGSIRADASRVRDVQARYPGLIQRVDRAVGERIARGTILATVEANDSLRSYAVTAPIGGVLTLRDAEAGQQTDSRTLFQVADFSTVWAEFVAFPRDRARLREGLPVKVQSEGTDGEGRIVWLSPSSSPVSQGVTVRVVLDNADGRWTPGQFVSAQVQLAEQQVPLVVPRSALQRFRDDTAVFAQFGETYEVRMLELGRRDAENVEVLGGLEPGTKIVVDNSYLLKAEIEKSGASHDH